MPETPPKPSLMDRLKAHLAEYGEIAIVIYFSIFGLVFAGFIVAINVGAQAETAGGWAATIGAAYGATKLTQPLRILGTLVLTPLIARLWRGRRPTPPPA